jgi:hypothetical protein
MAHIIVRIPDMFQSYEEWQALLLSVTAICTETLTGFGAFFIILDDLLEVSNSLRCGGNGMVIAL